jgi:hypothetical protein
MEEDLMKLEQQIAVVQSEKQAAEAKKPTDIHHIIQRVTYFLENLENILLKQIDPVKKAQFFGVLFVRTPRYDEIKTGTQKTPLLTGVNELFAFAKMEKSLMVILPVTDWNHVKSELLRWNDTFRVSPVLPRL